jgi:hypothetical protein
MQTPKRLPFPWLFRWKFWRVLLLLAASLVTLAALFHAEENWRGKRAWEDYKAQMEARGVNFDFAKYVPPPVPDDQNFAMTPLLAPLFDFNPGTQHERDTNGMEKIHQAMQLPTPIQTILNKSGWTVGKPLDLIRVVNEFEATNRSASFRFAPGQTQEAARAILEKLEPLRPVMDELRSASRRPYSRFNIAYDWEPKYAILLPELATVRQLCYKLELRACAQLTLGQTESALQDVELMFQLASSIRHEPFLFSHAACLNLTLQPVWEGLARHQWSEQQLEVVEQNLRPLDFLGDAAQALAAERCCADSFFAGLRGAANPLRFLESMGNLTESSDSDPWVSLAVSLTVPRGWFYFEELNYHRMYGEEFNGVIRTNGIDPAVADQRSAAVTDELQRPGFLQNMLRHRLMSMALLPALNGFERRMAHAQDNANLALMACSLERYRLANGRFPETLDALAPQFFAAVPDDVIMGESFIYRRTDDGQFVLYSVGWDKKDDNGVPAKERDDTHGDWVWKYSATSEH